MEKKCYDKIIESNPIKISIIAPVYGVECYIERFAESILSQTYPNIEFIFVNDGTKDKSIDILEKLIERKYAFRREHIKIIHKQNGGLPAARRSGLECATGDYVYNVDSDDWLAEDAIQRIADTGKDVQIHLFHFALIPFAHHFKTGIDEFRQLVSGDASCIHHFLQPQFHSAVIRSEQYCSFLHAIPSRYDLYSNIITGKG